MKNIFLIFLLLAVVSSIYSAPSLKINGGRAYKYETNVSVSGLDMGCYVVQRDVPVEISFVSESAQEMKLYSFKEGGISQKVLLPNAVQQGAILTLNGGEKDCGYIVEQGGNTYTFWVAGYIQVTSLENDYTYANICESARVVGEGITIPYHTIYGGIPGAIPRKVVYNTWLWNEEEMLPNESMEVEQIVTPDDKDRLVIDSPYEKTYITIVDDIPEAWGGVIKTISTSEEFEPKAIFLEGVVTQHEREVENEIEVENSPEVFGGSAPVDMTFEAFVNENNYHCWQFFQSANGPDDPSPVISATYLDKTLNYTFKDAGVTYVRLYSENSSCSKYVTYTISISESFIDAPNAFSPGTSPGVNDEWRVAYKSLIEFKCVIFDRWGVKMYAFEDPATGWDGNYKGKLVPPGVYYYVIQAKGSDGQEYELKGHINILRGKE